MCHLSAWKEYAMLRLTQFDRFVAFSAVEKRGSGPASFAHPR
jgi:hypothetical protein